MKKKTFNLALLLIILTVNSYSQSGWFWQNPLPQGNDYTMVKFYNENIGYAVGWRSSVIKTTNGGSNWMLVDNGLDELTGGGNFTCVSVIDENTVFASSNGLVKTTNGGINWILVSNEYSEFLDMFFINANYGFAIKYNIILKTTNGGINWNINIPSNAVRSVFFLDMNTGFLGCDEGYILKTTNSGENWIRYFTGIETSVNSIQFVNQQTGYCASSKFVLKTINGGLNWSIKFKTNYSSGGSINFRSIDTGYYCPWGGSVFRTINGGDSWDSVFIGGLLISVSSPQTNSCVVVGSGGVIFKTSNTGQNWHCISSPLGILGTLNSVVFPTNNIGYIFGENGTMLKTTDSGVEWFKLNSVISKKFVTSYFLNKDTGYIAGDLDSVLFTKNGGYNWTILATGNLDAAVYNIMFLDINTGFIVVHDKVYRTYNNGLNWNQVFYWAGSVINHIQFVNNQTGYFIMGTGGCLHCPPAKIRIFKTTDQGTNWYSIYSSGDYIYNQGFKMVNENIGYISNSCYIGNDKGIYKTTDGGINWFQKLNINSCGILFFINENTGFASSGFRTTDGGNNWYYQNTGIHLIKSVSFINSNTGFIVGGYNGSIVKTTNGGGNGTLVSINNLSYLFNNKFSLSQNYPNPFNPLTKIKFDVPKTSFTKLIIYDLLGREITTLVNEELKPGTYEADWDGTDYSSGVYLYKIISNDYTETRKMVLMK